MRRTASSAKHVQISVRCNAMHLNFFCLQDRQIRWMLHHTDWPTSDFVNHCTDATELVGNLFLSARASRSMRRTASRSRMAI
mmetsp:Transcript_5166/g.8323  ORF Transcript_5166/g.8323 Transcript_5166/m.8323 type:complete len:82 (+) Transcript_5166:199-444(+)